ncbi:MAG: Cj0069 family protein [Armatimonadetes bacterium]|nr:Cj0069 family protein [Armatimonadota bacterium]
MAGPYKMGLVWHGDRAARDSADLEGSRFAKAGAALRAVGIDPEAVIYNDDFIDEVRKQMLTLDAMQVWVNPIEDGRDRTKLDALLREVADAGVIVNTHPNTIMKMGTKQVLVDTRDADFGSDVRSYESLEELRTALGERLKAGAKVLKQFRGHSGGGIWKFALAEPSQTVDGSTKVLLRHAERGCPEELVTYDEAVNRMQPYFEATGKMIEQPFQDRIGDGMIRIYMVKEEVGGFGHQAAVALVPAAPGQPLPEMGPRLYYPPTDPQFQALRGKMESEWMPQLKRCLGLATEELPLLWDADFMFGPKDEKGEDTYILCEINVSSVSPYPEWANEPLARTALEQIKAKQGITA